MFQEVYCLALLLFIFIIFLELYRVRQVLPSFILRGEFAIFFDLITSHYGVLLST